MMKMPLAVIRLTAAAGALVACASIASAQNPFRFAGAPCVAPPVYKCPEANCPADRISNPGPVVEMKTRRTYFLDYPCDLKPGEPVTFILSLHGAGAPGNWQRHYFPLLDYKDRYRLVIATPNSPTRVWSDVDDDYLHNIVDTIVEQIGKQNIRAFWLVGHSQGGMTSNRIVRTDYFKDKVDGWLSLSGGRLGTNPGRGNFAGMAAPPGAARGAAPAGGRGAAPPTAAATGLPPTDFSFIYETGQREMDEKGLPEVSQWAQRLGCGPRGKPTDIVDTKGGYIYDTSRQNPPVPAWGLIARPGTAQVSQYSNCNDGRIVADVVRLEKGHTEGLEPNITEELVKLMLSAKGGKLHP
jgi:pimeloyl-ACP methyl ester carboxylesterase